MRRPPVLEKGWLDGWKMDGRWIEAFPQRFFPAPPCNLSSRTDWCRKLLTIRSLCSSQWKGAIKAECSLVFAPTLILCASRCSLLTVILRTIRWVCDRDAKLLILSIIVSWLTLKINWGWLIEATIHPDNLNITMSNVQGIHHFTLS